MRPSSSPSPPGDAAPRRDWVTIKALLPHLWLFKKRMGWAAVCLLIAKLATVTVPIVLKHIIDSLDPQQTPVVVLPLMLLLTYGLLRMMASGFGELRDAIFAKVTQSAIRQVAVRVFRHLHGLALKFHLERRTGGMSRDIERGSRGIAFLLHFMVFNVIPTLFEIFLVTAILFWLYNVWFAVITFVSLIFYILFSLWITEWRMKFRRTMNDMDSKANTRAIDSLLNYETVKYFGNEEYEAQRYNDNLQVWEHAAIKNQTSLGVLNFGQGAIIAAGMTGLLILASQGVLAGRLTLGDVVLINAYLLQLFLPLNFLGFVYREIKHSLVDMEKMFSLLNQAQDIKDPPGAPDLAVGDGAIVFEQVRFGYDAQRVILHDCSFQVPAGHKVAVVGSSGAGKSTLARLLFRFYDVDSGRILINGQDIRAATQASVRAAIGIVPQDTVLFNDTIYYNIAYARPNASREDVIAAARMAHIHDFIASLPEQYDTPVGERGLKLSGGEKQRVAIARVILKNPRILVFDEATSALDSLSERAILENLRELAAHHTTLVIAHRLSTIVDADTIIVLSDGRVAESGSHAELLARKGAYAALWHMQQEEKRHSALRSDTTIEIPGR